MQSLKNLRIFRLLLVSFTVFSCAQKAPQPLSPLLFPDGQYNQSVQLELYKPKKQTVPFVSLSKIKQGHFKILGLTPFGTKAFEAQGNTNKPGDTQVTLHMALPPSINPDFVRKTLGKIQKLHHLKRKNLSKKNDHDEFSHEGLVIKIFKYRSDGIPDTFTVSDQNWKAYIQTSDYKPFSGSL